MSLNELVSLVWTCTAVICFDRFKTGCLGFRAFFPVWDLSKLTLVTGFSCERVNEENMMNDVPVLGQVGDSENAYLLE